MHASQLTHPRLRVLYRLDGGARAPERSLPLDGYRASRPVRVGNAAAAQLQLDTYGELLQTAWLYATTGHRIDRDIGRRLAEMADLVCRIWRQPDAGIWEVRSEPRHFTQSKMMCWVALDRARDLAARGLIPDRHAHRWRREAEAIQEFVETRCFSTQKRSYVALAQAPRSSTRACSSASSLLRRRRGPSAGRGRSKPCAASWRKGRSCGATPARTGSAARKAPSCACSFWLAEALARTGRVDEAVA